MAIPFKNEKSWHYLFYELKKDKKAAGRPPCPDELEFDWGRAISEISRTIGFPSTRYMSGCECSVSKPHYETINLSKEVRNLWFKRHEEETPKPKSSFVSVLRAANRNLGLRA